jgi:hypothetical protein
MHPGMDPGTAGRLRRLRHAALFSDVLNVLERPATGRARS